MPNGKIFLLAIGMLASTVAIQTLRAQQAPAAGSDTVGIKQGYHTFVAMGCYQCHGYAGQGSQGTGPALLPLKLNAEAFARYVRNPRGVMPAFSPKLLPDAEIGPLLAYIRSLPPGRPIAEIPLLAHYAYNQPAGTKIADADAAAASAPPAHPEGAKLYAANCAACHGAERSGGAGPDLRSESQKRTAGDIAALIAAPPPGMPKLTPSPLSPAEVRQVAAYIYSGR